MKRLMILALALVVLTACASITLSFRTVPETLEVDELSSQTSAQLTEGSQSDTLSFRTSAQPTEKSLSSPAETSLPSSYYNEKVYEAAKQKADAYELSGTVTAGMIPHHGTASTMIASFFETLSESYDTVILIGPNHYEEGGAVVYSDCGWTTPKGDISCDSEFIQRLSKDLSVNAVLNNEAVQNDHSIGWHLPYLADYLPNTGLAAIMLQPTATESSLKALAELIADYAEDKKVLVLGSVDFSHYLMPDDAKQMDELTKNVIASADYGRLMRLSSDNVDSPHTVYVVMKAAEAMNSELHLLDQSISYEQAGGTELDVDPEEGTTTYLVYAAAK